MLIVALDHDYAALESQAKLLATCDAMFDVKLAQPALVSLRRVKGWLDLLIEWVEENSPSSVVEYAYTGPRPFRGPVGSKSVAFRDNL